jgi:hypothetical protein
VILVLVQIVYWLALATWFGGALFITFAWRIVFKSVQEANPILPHVLSVNLEGQHATLLAGTIVGNVLAAFLRVQIGCCCVLALTLAGQGLLTNMHDPTVFTSLVLRAILLIGAAGVVFYDWRVVWPKLWRYRQEFIDHADEPELANPAKDQFDFYQRQSVTLLEILLFLLLGMVLFSGATSVGPGFHPAQPETSHEAAPA